MNRLNLADRPGLHCGWPGELQCLTPDVPMTLWIWHLFLYCLVNGMLMLFSKHVNSKFDINNNSYLNGWFFNGHFENLKKHDHTSSLDSHWHYLLWFKIKILYFSLYAFPCLTCHTSIKWIQKWGTWHGYEISASSVFFSGINVYIEIFFHSNVWFFFSILLNTEKR